MGPVFPSHSVKDRDGITPLGRLRAEMVSDNPRVVLLTKPLNRSTNTDEWKERWRTMHKREGRGPTGKKVTTRWCPFKISSKLSETPTPAVGRFALGSRHPLSCKILHVGEKGVGGTARDFILTPTMRP